jgi:hypothetical protein
VKSVKKKKNDALKADPRHYYEPGIGIQTERAVS